MYVFIRHCTMDRLSVKYYAIHIFSFFILQSPQWLENGLNRMDHFATAFSQQIQLHNFKEHIEATLSTLTDKLELTGTLNGRNFSFPNVPLWLSTNIDAKFDTTTQLSFDWGFMRKFIFVLFINIIDC